MAVQKLKRPKKWTTIVIFPVLVFCFTKEKENRMALLELKKSISFFFPSGLAQKQKRSPGNQVLNKNWEKNVTVHKREG
jgi:cytochrome c-type biogenesis protein CcmE